MAHSDKSSVNEYMQNRELSWLKFNERVLEEAQDESVPLFERLKFVSIFTTNLDEFFMIRVGSLSDFIIMGDDNKENKTGMTPKEQLEKILRHTVPLYVKRDNIFYEIESHLREYDIFNLEISELEHSEKNFIEKYYESYIVPVLSPQVIDLRHPFPHLINKALYVVCEFFGEDKKFGLIPVSPALPEYLCLPGSRLRYVLTEKIILDHAKDIFKMYHIDYATVISVTRNADISLDDEDFEVDDDFRDRVKKVLKKRSRLSPVRLEIQGFISKNLTGFLLDKLDLGPGQIFKSKVSLTLKYPFDLYQKIPVSIKRQLNYPGFEPQYPVSLNSKESITSQCKKKDILLFYPYHRMEPFLHLLKESSRDPNVISIKITIYRLARNSKIVEYLCNAAENNKEVTVLIELKARFDENSNIEWAERLEEAGCNIIYGFGGYKVHSKICLITRRDRNKINYITHVGTGNYNEKTAKSYSDLSLITAGEEIGHDAADFFRNMSLSNLEGKYKHLWVAPYSLKDQMLEKMEQEILKARNGQKARILMKANSITDKEIIYELAKASQAGVQVRLIIRGICCILPGIPGKTENMVITSIVGRFLEHARIYCFGAEEDAAVYIASADMMTRNTIRRVEVACPIYDKEIKRQILEYLDIMEKDNVKARLLQPDGDYVRILQNDEEMVDSQQYFIEQVLSQTEKPSNPTRFVKHILSDVAGKYFTRHEK